MAELKGPKLDAYSNSESEPDKGNAKVKKISTTLSEAMRMNT